METRLFDVNKGTTRTMRSKEEAFDYRYFPEPDLVPVEPDKKWVDEIQQNLPELPAARYKRFVDEYKLPDHDSSLLVADKALADYYEDCVRAYGDPKTTSNWILNELMALMSSSKQTLDECRITPEHFAGI